MKKRIYHNGKRVSKGEKEISQYLDHHNINYIREKTFKECINFCGNFLRFDFYLDQFNLLIEYQGQHHEKPVNKYQRAKIVHDKTVVHDKIKEDFAAKHQINLIKINYSDYKNINIILDNLFNEIDGLLEGD